MDNALNWLPRAVAMLIDLAKIWIAWLVLKGDAHNIAENLREKLAADTAKLIAAHDANVNDSSPLRVEAEKEAREAVEQDMTFLKNNYFTKDLCTRMELKELHILKDNRSGKRIQPAKVPARIRSCEPVTAGHLRPRFEIAGDLPEGVGPESFDFVCAYSIVVPPGTVLGPGATLHTLETDPSVASELTNGFVSNSEYFDLVVPSCYRGCKIWFSACLRNDRNEDGDYGPLFYTYVP
jgi:hypothetical protein